MKRRKSFSFDAAAGVTEPRFLRRSFHSAGSRLLPFVLGAAVLFSILPLLLGDRGVAQLWELGWREKELRSQLQDLEAEAELLAWEARESGPMAVERPAREKFQMQRPGEIVYYFPRGDAEPDGAGSASPGDFDAPGPNEGAVREENAKPVDISPGDR